MELFPRNLQTCLSAVRTLTEESLRLAVQEASSVTDAQFLSKVRERELNDGSTLILGLLFPDDSGNPLRYGDCKLLVANVGDCRAVLCRGSNGQQSAIRISNDHKPDRKDERRRIEKMGGKVDMIGVWRVFTPGDVTFGGKKMQHGLAVSRAFGDLLLKEPHRYGCPGVTGSLVTAVPEIHCQDLTLDDDRFLILACDGIWDVISDDEAVAICKEHHEADSAAHALVRKAFEVGSGDNLTAVVVAWELNSGRGQAKKQRVA